MSVKTENGRCFDPELRCDLWEAARRHVRKTELGKQMPCVCPKAPDCGKVEPECVYTENPIVRTVYLHFPDHREISTPAQKFDRKLKGWKNLYDQRQDPIQAKTL